MGLRERATNYAKEKLIKEIMHLLPKFSTKNVIRMIELGESITNDPEYKYNARRLRELFEEGHPAAILIKDVINSLSRQARDKLIQNLFINAFLTGINRRKEILNTEGWQPPQFVVISPTMRCNLKCPGCYAGLYPQDEGLPFETIDRILTEGKELGMYFNTMSGGEVFMRKDIFDIWEKHNDMYFQIYTNGTMINEKVADKLAKLGNVAPMMSLEGFEEATDERRGKGTFKKVMRAMDLLRERGLVFGASLTETRENIETLASYDFVDMLVEKGAMVIWYFQYIPIGRYPSMDIMPTPKQRDWLRRRLKEIRDSRPIFIGDFWNDGPYVKGCIAGGREYLHINSEGNVEPCVFAHFAVDNIKNKSLRDVLNSPFMRGIRKLQPYRENLLTPCMIIDNPHVLRKVVNEYHARPTCEGAEEIITTFAEDLDRYAEEYKKYADPAWEAEWKSTIEEKKKKNII
ncbi:MAG: radical SAM protein [Candidatus Latescibacteria bacterium 4484_7]|nr:MAG: radical SAM protein [Candidatus Latescibacteria bacterium 4484_7]